MATCKDCIHCEACERMISDTSKMFKVLLPEILKMNCDIKYDSTNILSGAEICQCFQDRARFVELPCKIGTELFRIKQINGKPFVTNTALNKNTFWEIVIKGEFGKTVFLTREEAKQALKGRENSV